MKHEDVIYADVNILYCKETYFCTAYFFQVFTVFSSVLLIFTGLKFRETLLRLFFS